LSFNALQPVALIMPLIKQVDKLILIGSECSYQ